MVKIDDNQCVGCGMCVSDCVAGNLSVQDKKAIVKGACFRCGHCVAICPVGAVSIPEYDMDDVEEYNPDTFDISPENLLNTIKFRRSIRFFKPQPVEEKDLTYLLQAGRYTATAKNDQDCCFVFVQQEREELKRRVWQFIDEMVQREGRSIAREKLPYVAFNRQRKADPDKDYLFKNAPMVLYITSDWPLDAGLAAQNIETMAAALGMGALYNGYLARITDANEELKAWLGLEGKEIRACLLLGYPARCYARTAPRGNANVIRK